MGIVTSIFPAWCPQEALLSLNLKVWDSQDPWSARFSFSLQNLADFSFWIELKLNINFTKSLWKALTLFIWIKEILQTLLSCQKSTIWAIHKKCMKQFLMVEAILSWLLKVLFQKALQANFYKYLAISLLPNRFFFFFVKTLFHFCNKTSFWQLDGTMLIYFICHSI